MRCRNCGDPGHLTHNCQWYGPWFPEAGKTAADYAEMATKIADLVAADIIAEHNQSHQT